MKHAKTILGTMLRLRGSAFGLAEGSIFLDEPELIPKDVHLREKLQLPPANYGGAVMPTYSSVTFNTVVNPVFTVAVVLMPVKPEADTVTV